jgi:hypothetical protein
MPIPPMASHFRCQVQTGKNQHGDKTDIGQTEAEAAQNEQAATQTIRAAIEALAGSQAGQKTT